MKRTAAKSAIGYIFVGIAIVIGVLILDRFRLLLRYQSASEVFSSITAVDIVFGAIGGFGLFMFGLSLIKSIGCDSDRDKLPFRKLIFYLAITVIFCLAAVAIVFSFGGK